MYIYIYEKFITGTYRCVASNSEGSDQKDFNVEINSEPSFARRPAEVLNAPNEKETTVLYCKAEGKPKPNVTWYKNGVEMTNMQGKEGV